MTEQHEFVAEDGTGAQSANGNRHASPGIPVAQRLGTIRFRSVDQSMLRSAGQLEAAWIVITQPRGYVDPNYLHVMAELVQQE